MFENFASGEGVRKHGPVKVAQRLSDSVEIAGLSTDERFSTILVSEAIPSRIDPNDLTRRVDHGDDGLQLLERLGVESGG